MPDKQRIWCRYDSWKRWVIKLHIYHKKVLGYDVDSSSYQCIRWDTGRRMCCTWHLEHARHHSDTDPACKDPVDRTVQPGVRRVTDTLVSAHLVDTFTVNAWIWMTTVHVLFTVVTCIKNIKQNVTFWGFENVQTTGQRHSPIHLVHIELKITVHGKILYRRTLTTPHCQHACVLPPHT